MPAVLMFLPDIELAPHGAGACAGEACPGGKAGANAGRGADGSHDPWRWEPLAILVGCDYSNAGAEDERRTRHGLAADHCGVLDPQWVVSIGGWVLDCDVTGACEPPADSRREPDDAARGAAPASAAPTPADAAAGADAGARAAPRGDEREAGGAARLALACHASSCPRSHAHPIVGGVVVPLYFVLIALLGGAIGLLRKLPEFQHRSDDDYAPAEGEPTKLAPNQARDFVLFQLVQVLTAPIVALVAFALVEPSDVTATLLLAFAAGFSSEPFLVLVREFAERVANSRAEEVPAGRDARLVVGRYVRLLGPVGDRPIASVGRLTEVDSAKGVAKVEFVDAAGKPVEEVPIAQLEGL